MLNAFFLVLLQKGRWATFLVLFVPILLTIAFYNRESLGIPVPERVVDTRNGEKDPFAVNYRLIRLKALALKEDTETHTFGKPDRALNIPPQNFDGEDNVVENSNIYMGEKTAERTFNGMDPRTDTFIFSKHSVGANVTSHKNETRKNAEDDERTLLLKIDNGMMLAEDIQAEHVEDKPGDAREPIVPFPSDMKDLSGYVSIVNQRNVSIFWYMRANQTSCGMIIQRLEAGLDL